MAVSTSVNQRLIDEMMRLKGKEFEDANEMRLKGNEFEYAITDAMIYGSGAVKSSVPQYSLVEIVLMDGTTQAFTLKAPTSIVKHLVKEMRESGYLTMWNDTDVLCIRADQVKQFALRAITKE